MKYFIFILFLLCFSQTKPVLETTFLSKTPVKDKSLIGMDNFNSSYFLVNNSLIKKTSDRALNYNNLQLGTIESINTFNPLKINVFYKDFNSVVILDNRLAEIYKIDFNANKSYKNVSLISSGYDNTIWIFNQDTQQLELFDYKSNTIKTRTLPVESDVLDLKSNFNYCWLLTKDYLYKFNYFGTNILKLKNEEFTSLYNINENLLLQKDNKLFFIKNNSSQPVEIQLPKLLINALFVNNETLYIYDDKFLYKYQLKIN